MQDVFILQSETKMKAALGQKVKISLPKAFQTSKNSTKSLAVKGVSTDITEAEFKEFLDLNKISYAKAERLKSKKDGRVLPIFQLEITDPNKAEAFISQNLVRNVTGIVYKVEDFRAPTSIMQCYNCQCFGHLAKTCRSKQICLICGENHSHKGCLSRESRKPTCANCKGPQGVRNTKSRRPAPKTYADIYFYRRTAHQIRGKRGYPNRPTTCLLPKSKTRHTGSEI